MAETFNAIIRNAPYNLGQTALNYAFLYNIQEAFNRLSQTLNGEYKEYGQEFIREPIDMKPTTNPLRKVGRL